MKKNLNDQVHEMQLKLNENDISIVDFIKRIKETVFQRDFLSLTIDEEKEKEAEKVIAKYEILTSDILKIKDSIKEKQIFLSELKPPLIFGKAKYQETIGLTNNEINTLNQSLEKFQTQIDSINNSYMEAIDIKNRFSDENKKNELQYNNDEMVFENEKNKIISSQAKQLCNIPSNILKGEWDDILLYLKTFFRQSPGKHLFPLIGWEYAFEYSAVIATNYDNWKNDTSSIIINGESIEVKELFAEFLMNYIDSVNDHWNPIYNIIKAKVLFIELLDNEDVNFLYGSKDKFEPNTFKQVCSTLVNSPDNIFGIKLRELYSTLKVGKEKALKQNDENILNVITELEAYYLNAFSWINPFLS